MRFVFDTEVQRNYGLKILVNDDGPAEAPKLMGAQRGGKKASFFGSETNEHCTAGAVTHVVCPITTGFLHLLLLKGGEIHSLECVDPPEVQPVSDLRAFIPPDPMRVTD